MIIDVSKKIAFDKILKTYANSVSDMLAIYLSAKLTFFEMGMSLEDVCKCLEEVENIVKKEYESNYKEAEDVFTGKVLSETFMMRKVKEKINE